MLDILLYLHQPFIFRILFHFIADQNYKGDWWNEVGYRALNITSLNSSNNMK